MNTLLEEMPLSRMFCLLSEKGSTLKRENVLALGANFPLSN